MFWYILIGLIIVFIIVPIYMVKRKMDVNKSVDSVPYHVVGVTFKNEDGSSRQAILKKIQQEKEPFDVVKITLQRYKYNGENAIGVFANDEQIGNIAQKDVQEIINKWSRFYDVDDIRIIGGVGEKKDNYGAIIVVRYNKANKQK